MIPEHMAAVHLAGRGGRQCLRFRTGLPVPPPGPGAVLVQVTAAGLTSFGISTRAACFRLSNADGGGSDEGIAAVGGRAGPDVLGKPVAEYSL
ncbi:hypothetical protein [Leisingera sp. ANG-Vp]|uniref:hypothetical protein n=1 Tax=Leisingera sp. ANG-Vp TaxID=1577896 RepID=UPI00058019AE|nr:hypothetical protein [Leisingera sp. ANG-Vp]KIC18903.1 hypothetical protein RA20_13005 [Leisingera sp. ANG-Vp]